MEMSSGGVAFALNHATLEGKITIGVLLLFSLVSWTVIINKFRQLAKAKKRNGLFLGYYSKAKGPLVIFGKGPIKQLQGSPCVVNRRLACADAPSFVDRPCQAC